MDSALTHFISRFFDPFNSESRFYWPFAAALALGIVTNVVWYYTQRRSGVAPGELAVRPWAVWANLITLIWCALLMIAKAPFIFMALAFALDVAANVYLYWYWLPPREAAWGREVQRQRYIPQADRKKRKRRTA